jgi:15-cis-phytoene synthase
MSATPDVHSARYFALLYASAVQRPAFEALFGIEREVFDSLRPGLDHNVAHSRLQWWREECERAAGGRAVHPLTRALVSALNGAPLSQLAGLCGIVDVAIWDLAGATFETRRELDAYCQRWATGMVEPLAHASLSAASVSAASPAPAATNSSASAARTVDWRALGAAMRETELLADFAREAHYGRIRVPLDELETANIDANTLAKPPWPDAFADLVRVRLESLRNDIERNLIGVDPEQQPALRGLLAWAALTWRNSQRTERALPNRLQPSRFDTISDAWFAWRIARRATIGRFRLS